jgi:DNA (cytosine-5)-methyltransferase 1
MTGLNYLSVCSGIEAATVAWHDMGWKPVGFSEIEKYPSEVLAHHYPDVTNYGDMTKYKEWNINESIDLLVGGTPCQAFSVAGLRKGLDDPRGNLALVYCGLLDHYKPKWFVWENVPGVLSSNGGRDFGSFLGALAELGYGFAYRVFDAQYFGVAQRRRRVFVVGYLGDWRPAAEVLFESDCMRRDNPPSRETREITSAFTSSSFGGYSEGTGTLRAAGGDLGGGSETLVAKWPADIASTLNAHFGSKQGLENQHINQGAPLFVPATKVYETHPADSRVKEMGETCQTVTSRWGTGGGNVPIASDSMRVRRLTPIECERLQGFPNDYTNIKEKTPDGNRYKALGNSMAVPVMKWIGQRINAYAKT